MAKTKVAINIKLDMLGECNKKDLDRLLKKPFDLKKKNFEYTATKTVEVVDPEWTPKIFQQNLFYSVRRRMQILAARASDGLKAFDKESKPKKKEALPGDLKKQLVATAKEVSRQADSNLKKIIDEATKDATKWDKGREAKDFVEDIEEEREKYKKSIVKITEGFKNAKSDVNNLHGDLWTNHDNVRDMKQKAAEGKLDGADKTEYKKVMAIQKRKRAGIKARLTEMGGTFNNYGSSQSKYKDLLKSSKKRLPRMIDSKTKGADEEMKKLSETFKDIGLAAEKYTKYLEAKNEQMENELKPLLKFNTENEGGFDDSTGESKGVEKRINTLLLLVPKAGTGLERRLFSLITMAKKDMKKIKAGQK